LPEENSFSSHYLNNDRNGLEVFSDLKRSNMLSELLLGRISDLKRSNMLAALWTWSRHEISLRKENIHALDMGKTRDHPSCPYVKGSSKASKNEDHTLDTMMAWGLSHFISIPAFSDSLKNKTV